MYIKKNKISASIALVAAGALPSANADFDQWQINEIFTNSDGSIQFVELSTTASDQGDLSGQLVISTDTNQQQRRRLAHPALWNNRRGQRMGALLAARSETTSAVLPIATARRAPVPERYQV